MGRYEVVILLDEGSGTKPFSLIPLRLDDETVNGTELGERVSDAVTRLIRYAASGGSGGEVRITITPTPTPTPK